MSAVAVAAELPEYAGITRDECPIDCAADRCCITHAAICGHPHKGGLQPVHKTDSAVLARYNKPRRHLSNIVSTFVQGKLCATC